MFSLTTLGAHFRARALWSGREQDVRRQFPATRLTQTRKREAKGIVTLLADKLLTDKFSRDFQPDF